MEDNILAIFTLVFCKGLVNLHLTPHLAEQFTKESLKTTSLKEKGKLFGPTVLCMRGSSFKVNTEVTDIFKTGTIQKFSKVK